MNRSSVISMADGSGGQQTRQLIESVFLRHFSNSSLSFQGEDLGDAALLPEISGQLAFSTDSFVVKPFLFPGGNIGTLGVNGTVNDLAVAGAVPRYLSVAMILEEGLGKDDLETIAFSMGEAAREEGVSIVAGDTKVVERGHGDGIFLSTSGIGVLRKEPPPGPKAVQAKDVVVVSGPVGDHGAVIAALRSGIDPQELKSDCRSVFQLVEAVYKSGVRPRFMRDPTRGGIATALAELAGEAKQTVVLQETQLPIRDSVKGICELLGLDPLYLACEGQVVMVVPREQADWAVEAMRAIPSGAQAAVVGEISHLQSGPVILQTRYGGSRLYNMLSGEHLPRIC